MRLGIAALTLLLSATAAQAYTHRWVYNDKYVGVEIHNNSNQKISCNEKVVVNQCFGWSCDDLGKGGPTGIIQPGGRHISGWYAGAGVS